MGGLPDPIRDHGGRLRIVSLVHHPLADETGLSPSDEDKFRDSEREALKHCAGVVVTSRFTAHRLAGYGVPGKSNPSCASRDGRLLRGPPVPARVLRLN